MPGLPTGMRISISWRSANRLIACDAPSSAAQSKCAPRRCAPCARCSRPRARRRGSRRRLPGPAAARRPRRCTAARRPRCSWAASWSAADLHRLPPLSRSFTEASRRITCATMSDCIARYRKRLLVLLGQRRGLAVAHVAREQDLGRRDQLLARRRGRRNSKRTRSCNSRTWRRWSARRRLRSRLSSACSTTCALAGRRPPRRRARVSCASAPRRTASAARSLRARSSRTAARWRRATGSRSRRASMRAQGQDADARSLAAIRRPC